MSRPRRPEHGAVIPRSTRRRIAYGQTSSSSPPHAPRSASSAARSPGTAGARARRASSSRACSAQGRRARRAVGEVIMGQVLAAGCGPEPGAPDGRSRPACRTAMPALTINKVCGSGLKAVMLAAQAVGVRRQPRSSIAGGQENMSAVAARAARLARRPAHGRLEAGRLDDHRRPVGRLQPVPHGHHRRERGQEVRHHAREQDALALASQQKAAAAQEAGRFKDEIVPVSIRRRRATRSSSRPTSSSTARPAPRRWPACGPPSTRPARVTAGNASGLNDGAAAVMVMSASNAPRRWA